MRYSTLNSTDATMTEVPVIVDGGLATELEAAGLKIQGDPLWSARILHSNPQAVKSAHYRFLQSGADVIATASYQASIQGFVQHLGVSVEQANQLLMSSVHLARQALVEFVASAPPSGDRVPMVAGSVGPYGAFLHDGSEYSGAYDQDMTVEELMAWHRPRLQCLVSAGADIIAMETIPSLKEAEALVELLREFPASKAWLSFSCKDEKHISNGRLFSEAVRLAQRSQQLVAVGVNCCAPPLIEPLLVGAGPLSSPDLSWIVYPNSGEEWDQDVGWKTSERRTSFARLSTRWRELGASWIGGCCRVSPADITELRSHLEGNPVTGAS